MRLPRSLRSARAWLARAILTLLLGATMFLGWLWISAKVDRPQRFFHSTSRYCSYIGFVGGRFVMHYDGGADQGVVKTRDWRFLGIFCRSGGGLSGWQTFNCGIDGWFAVAALAVGWFWAGWLLWYRPWSRRHRGRCLRCGYDLVGITSAVCPECGTPRVTRPPAPPPARLP